jgi:hypothetical protein
LERKINHIKRLKIKKKTTIKRMGVKIETKNKLEDNNKLLI